MPSDAADGNGTQEEGAAADAAAADAGNQATAAAGGGVGEQAPRRDAAASTSPTVDLQKRQAAAMAAVERMASAKSTKGHFTHMTIMMKLAHFKAYIGSFLSTKIQVKGNEVDEER